MKIIHIIDSVCVGGAENVMINLCNLLQRKQVDVSILLISNNKGNLIENLDENIPIIILNRKSKYDLIGWYNFSKHLRKFDIAHVHMRHNFSFTTIVSKFFRCNIKIILHDHYGSIEFDKTIPKFFGSFLKPKYYIGVSKLLTNWAKKKLKINSKNVFLLGNTIEKMAPKKSKRNSRKQYVSIGNIKPVKNQLFAIQLISNLDADLTFFGRIQDDNYYKKILSEIKKFGLEKNIHFVTNENNIQNRLCEFDFGMHTAISESGPLVLIEFLAQNLPFVSFKTGYVSDILVDEIPNFFVDDFDTQKWIEIINKNNKKNHNLEALFDKYFSPEKYVNDCLKIYQKI